MQKVRTFKICEEELRKQILEILRYPYNRKPPRASIAETIRQEKAEALLTLFNNAAAVKAIGVLNNVDWLLKCDLTANEKIDHIDAESREMRLRFVAQNNGTGHAQVCTDQVDYPL